MGKIYWNGSEHEEYEDKMNTPTKPIRVFKTEHVPAEIRRSCVFEVEESSQWPGRPIKVDLHASPRWMSITEAKALRDILIELTKDRDDDETGVEIEYGGSKK